MRSLRRFCIVTICFLQSCGNNIEQKKGDDQIQKDEYEILSLAFDLEIGSDSAMRNRLMPISYEPSDPRRKAEILKDANRARKNLDTIQLVVLVYDTQILFSKETPEIKTILSPKNFSANFENIDTAYIPLLIKMASSTKIEKIDPGKIKTQFNYSLRTGPIKAGDIPNSGSIAFSPICFNEQSDLACMYCEYLCGELCGVGTIYFFKKVNGKWLIAGRRAMWVS